MALTVTTSVQGTGGPLNGVAFRSVASLTESVVVGADPSLAAAKTGTLTTRTSGTAGVLTMDAGHGISSTNRLDIYWFDESGNWIGSATDASVSVSGNAVTIDNLSGDALPALNAAVVAMVPTACAFVAPYTGLLALMVGASSTSTPWVAEFWSGGGSPAKIARFEGQGGGTAFASTTQTALVWDGGAPNPFGTSNAATVYLSHGLSTASVQVVALAVY